jgi:hypothetical protein
MTKYLLDKWEHNGPDDSDWYAVVYDDETDSISRIQTGSTRYANAMPDAIESTLIAPTEPVKARVRTILAGMYFSAFREIEDRKVLEPDPKELTGQRVRLLAPVKNQKKESVPCRKCGGRGKWTNPRNPTDVPACFTCNGTGHKPGDKLKNAAGKPVWDEFSAGTVGTCIRTGFYGKTYLNGYNTVNRSNTTVYMLLEDGREVRVACDKVRLDAEPKSDELVRKEAERRAETLAVYPFYATAGIRL